MCGIIGLHLRTPALHDRLGALVVPMLEALTTRGPDSAGVALYQDAGAERLKYSLRRPHHAGVDWFELATGIGNLIGEDVSVHPRWEDAVLVAAGSDRAFLDSLHALAPEVGVVGYGHALEIYKDVGFPAEVCARYEVEKATGYQAVGHTRMATESAVTTEHSHPFAAGPDLVLVHNGSFSNHASIRRDLLDAGVEFDTDNDSEVAARYIGEQLRTGADLGDALRMVLKTFDGFFTLLVATRDQFAVVRDSFACKPAVIAQTDDYVAMASEYVALAGLPGIEAADVFEPMPAEVHVWTR
jgi:methylamine---glutamate N-methyltransferase subunit A